MNTSALSRFSPRGDRGCGRLPAILAVLAMVAYPCQGRGGDPEPRDRRPWEAYIESHPGGRVDWESGMIYGVGRGYPDENRGSKNRALAAAQAEALQSILSLAARIRLDHTHTLEALEKGPVSIELRALIRHEDHETRYVDEARRPYVEVTRRAPITGIDGLTARLLDLLKSLPVPWKPLPAPAPARDSETGLHEDGVETWLVLDARGLSHDRSPQPALFPRIIGPAGDTVYSVQQVDAAALVREGMARYVVSDATADALRAGNDIPPKAVAKVLAMLAVRSAAAEEKKGAKKGRKKFVVTDVKQVQGLNRTDLMIGAEDARRLKTEGAAQEILKNCRVIVIVNSPIGGVEGSLDHAIARSAFNVPWVP